MFVLISYSTYQYILSGFPFLYKHRSCWLEWFFYRDPCSCLLEARQRSLGIRLNRGYSLFLPLLFRQQEGETETKALLTHTGRLVRLHMLERLEAQRLRPMSFQLKVDRTSYPAYSRGNTGKWFTSTSWLAGRVDGGGEKTEVQAQFLHPLLWAVCLYATKWGEGRGRS